MPPLSFNQSSHSSSISSIYMLMLPMDPVDAAGGSREDYSPWPLDDADQMTSFFLSSPSPPRALSPVGFVRLWNFDDGPNSPLDMSTGPPAVANHDGAPAETGQGTTAVVLSSPRRQHLPPTNFDHPTGCSMEDYGPWPFGDEEMRSLFVWSPSPPPAPSLFPSWSQVESCNLRNLDHEYVSSLEASSSPAEINHARTELMVAPQRASAGGNCGSPSEEFERINRKWQFLLFRNDDGTVSSSIFKQKLLQALAFFKQLTDLHLLVQVWDHVKNGDHYVLTTSGQPFAIDHHSHSIGLLQFREICMMYMYAVDGNNAGELGLPGWVYLQKVPEWTPNVQYYYSAEYPQLNHAGHKLQRPRKSCLALPVFDPFKQSCISVIELVITSKKFNYADEVDKICKALEAVNLRSTNMFERSSAQVSTSHLSRHLKSVHHTDLSANTEASMESQRSSCSKVQQVREISDNLIPSIEGNENEANCELIELDNKDVELESVNVSKEHKNGTSRSRSEVWLHFTKIVDIEDSGIVKARCKHCDQVLKADSRKNGTSRLRRHVTDFHRIKLAGSLKIKKRL